MNTNSPVLGNGTADSALNTLIYASAGSYTLSSIGDSLSYTGSVSMSDLTGTLARGLRWGLFNSNGSSNSNGWLGYVAENASGTTGSYSSVLVERNNPNAGSWWSATGATTVSSLNEANNADLASGNYNFSLVATLTATNTLTIYWTLTGVNVSYSLSCSYVDLSPQTLTFTTVGIGTASMGASLINFSNMSITFTPIPEPSLVFLFIPLMVVIFLLKRRNIMA